MFFALSNTESIYDQKSHHKGLWTPDISQMSLTYPHFLSEKSSRVYKLTLSWLLCKSPLRSAIALKLTVNQLIFTGTVRRIGSYWPSDCALGKQYGFSSSPGITCIVSSPGEGAGSGIPDWICALLEASGHAKGPAQ